LHDPPGSTDSSGTNTDSRRLAPERVARKGLARTGRIIPLPKGRFASHAREKGGRSRPAPLQTTRHVCRTGRAGLSQPSSLPTATRYRPRCPGSARPIRCLVPSATPRGRGGRWGPGRRCRCTCPWRGRS